MDVREQIERFPRTPGVYLMKDTAGRIVYVGKTKNLRNRVHDNRGQRVRLEWHEDSPSLLGY